MWKGISAAKWNKVPLAQFSLLIFVIGATTRIALVVGTKSYVESYHAEVVRVAQSLAKRGAFANPFCGETGPTAHMAPAYPYLLSLVYKVMGTGTAGDASKEILTCIIAALGFSLLPLIAVNCNMPARVGVLAGLAGASFPIRKWQETSGEFEVVCTAVVFMVVFLLTLRTWRDARFDSPAALSNGLGWGAILLFNPTFLAVLVGVLVVGGIRFIKIRGHQYLRYVAVLTIVCCGVLAPWTIRNYRVFGSLIPVRDNLGLEFYVSNSDMSKPTMKLSRL
jgi:hypothetical protein